MSGWRDGGYVRDFTMRFDCQPQVLLAVSLQRVRIREVTVVYLMEKIEGRTEQML